jgi:hypothetical protein
MRYALILLFTLFFTTLGATGFNKVNPEPTQAMLLSESNATVCENPAFPTTKFTKTFTYGCFCGQDYPALEHPSKKHYTEMNQTQRDELIVQYYAIKSYDSIDAVCFQHDICYLYNTNEEQICNDTIYSSLRDLEKKFRKNYRNNKENKEQRRCKNLSSDMASVFKTLFTVTEDTSLARKGAFTINTPITVISKLLRNSSYPKKDEICNEDNELN